MIIAVDHGNKSIKTAHDIFTSGLVVSEGTPGFRTDYLVWKDKYYTLTERRIAYRRDKTVDDRFFVLTLFAIAKELEHNAGSPGHHAPGRPAACSLRTTAQPI